MAIRSCAAMPSALLRRYHELPPSLRSVAATLRGGYLRAWRYGPGADRACEAVLARDGWSADRWRAWQEERLALVLHRARTRVPHYRAHWDARRRRGDRASPELLANWPVLEKAALRRDPAAFVADDRDPRRMFREHTSGTTGASLDVWLSRATLREWYALYEARARRWHGASRHDRWAIVGGQLVVPVAQDRPPFWVRNAALGQLYLSAYHLAPRHAAAYADALRRHGTRHLVGYPSALHALARGALDAGVPLPHLDVVVTNAEPLLAHQRETVAAAFGCAVRETYGMAELACAASECAHGRLHVWPEVGIVEIDAAAAHDDAGDVVATGLLNADMPLVRYRVGDRAAPGDDAAPCPCGRALPTLARVEGRCDDVLYTADGRAVGRLDPVFKAGAALREAQIVQEALDRVRVRYVPGEGFAASDADVLVERLRDRLGDVEVVLEAVPAIPRTANGKFRAVVCRLGDAERRRVGAA